MLLYIDVLLHFELVELMFGQSEPMKHLNISLNISSETYLRDPESTELGKNIISSGIRLIDQLGFEDFTFKKLGASIGSPESTIYRYFENKHMFLIYLCYWYWSWIEFKLLFLTANVEDSTEKLNISIRFLTEKIEEDNAFSHVDEVKLDQIVMNEGTKSYHIKRIDQENEKGYFQVYKRVVHRVSHMVLELDPTFEYPHMLISTVLDGSRQQRFFSEHLPSLTDQSENKNHLSNFYIKMIFGMLGKSPK